MNLDLTKGNPMKVIWEFMIPLFIGNVFQQLYNMCDTIIVGRFVGAGALGAVGSTGTIMFLVIGFSTGLTQGFTVLTAQRCGAKDEEGMKISVANAILLSIVVILVMTTASLLAMRGILTLMNTPKAIFRDAETYITIICKGIVCSVAFNLFSAFLRSVGNSKAPLVFLIISAVLNVVLDLCFIINFHMGVAGAAHATVLSQGVSAALCVVYILKKVRILVPYKDQWHFHRHATKAQLTVGVPMALESAITASGTMIMQTAVNSFGAVAVEAFSASNKIQSLLTQGMFSMGQVMASYTGQNYGKGDVDRIHKGVKAAVLSMCIYSVAAAVLVIVLTPATMRLFFASHENFTELLKWARPYVWFCTVCYIPLSFIFIFRSTMQGCGYGLLPMCSGITELLCRTATAGLSMHFHNYLLAAFCDPSAWIGAGIFTLIAYSYIIRQVAKQMGKPLRK